MEEDVNTLEDDVEIWQDPEDGPIGFYDLHRGDALTGECVLCGQDYDIYKGTDVYLTGAGQLCPRCFLTGVESVRRYRPEWDDIPPWDVTALAKRQAYWLALWHLPKDIEKGTENAWMRDYIARETPKIQADLKQQYLGIVSEETQADSV